MKKIVESWNDKKELWNHGIMKKMVELWRVCLSGEEIREDSIVKMREISHA